MQSIIYWSFYWLILPNKRIMKNKTASHTGIFIFYPPLCLMANNNDSVFLLIIHNKCIIELMMFHIWVRDKNLHAAFFAKHIKHYITENQYFNLCLPCGIWNHPTGWICEIICVYPVEYKIIQPGEFVDKCFLYWAHIFKIRHHKNHQKSEQIISHYIFCCMFHFKKNNNIYILSP